MKRLLPILLLILTVSTLMPTGCANTSCYDNSSSIPLVQFRDSGTDKAVTLTGIEIHGVGAPGDSVLLSQNKSASEVYLPMRSTASSTTWCLQYVTDDEVTDTVRFIYRSEPYFASEACGAMYRYYITEVYNTSNMLDSVVVLDSLITNEDIVRIAFYFNVSAQTPEQE